MGLASVISSLLAVAAGTSFSFSIVSLC